MYFSLQLNDRAEVIRDYKTGDSLCYAFIGEWNLDFIYLYLSKNIYNLLFVV